MSTFTAYLATVMGKLPKTSKVNPVESTDTSVTWYKKTAKAYELTGLEENLADTTSHFSNTAKINTEAQRALAGDDTVIGSGFADSLHGYAGNDTIYGGSGKDVLYGDAGADVFVFDEPISNSNVDTIKDFNLAEGDTLMLDSLVFTGLTVGTLDSAHFLSTRSTKPGMESAEPHIIYKPNTGTLYFDADGAGTEASMVKVAVIVGKPNLQPSHIQVSTTLDLDLY